MVSPWKKVLSYPIAIDWFGTPPSSLRPFSYLFLGGFRREGAHQWRREGKGEGSCRRVWISAALKQDRREAESYHTSTLDVTRWMCMLSLE